MSLGVRREFSCLGTSCVLPLALLVSRKGDQSILSDLGTGRTSEPQIETETELTQFKSKILETVRVLTQYSDKTLERKVSSKNNSENFHAKIEGRQREYCVA